MTPGIYEIVATAPDTKFEGQLFVEVAPKPNEKISSFSVNLINTSPRGGGLTLKEIQSAASEQPTAHLRKFSGLLIDQSGAPIPGTSIVLASSRSKSPADIEGFKSDADGHFSAQLAAGTYVALFQMAAFKRQAVAFEIGGDDLQELRVALMVGSC